MRKIAGGKPSNKKFKISRFMIVPPKKHGDALMIYPRGIKSTPKLARRLRFVMPVDYVNYFQRDVDPAKIPPLKPYKWMYQNDVGGGYSVMSPTMASEVENFFQLGDRNFWVVNNGIGHTYSVHLNGDKLKPKGIQINTKTRSKRKIKRVAGIY